MEEKILLNKYSRLVNFPEFNDDKEFVLKIVIYDPTALKYISDDLKKDLEFLKKALSFHGDGLKYLLPEQREKTRLVYEALKSDGLALKHTSKKFNNDPKFVHVAVEQNPKSVLYAAKEVTHDKEFIRFLVKTYPKIYEFLPNDLQNDKKICEAALKGSPEIFKYFPKNMRSKKHLAEICLAKNGILLEFCSINNNFNAIIHADTSLLNDKLIMKSVISKNGLYLALASLKIQNTFEVVEIAVKNNGLALKYTKKYQTKMEICLSAVRNNGLTLEFVSRDVRKDGVSKYYYNGREIFSNYDDYHFIVETALKKNPLAMKYFDKASLIQRHHFNSWAEHYILPNLKKYPELFSCFGRRDQQDYFNTCYKLNPLIYDYLLDELMTDFISIETFQYMKK
eukprot:gene2994-5004_t